MSIEICNKDLKSQGNQMVCRTSIMPTNPQKKENETLIDSKFTSNSTLKFSIDNSRYDNSNSSLKLNIQNPNTTIPTRFFNRLSNITKQANPYKFNVNYSAAGQQLALKAKEQLKSAKSSDNLDSQKNDAPLQKNSKKNDEDLNDDWKIVSKYSLLNKII